ncbi:MAG: hypothetical protein OEW35_07445 [Gammaproteobacteria bacterium]|nr:hypothetical protein [Gammaproteobacteria bacterium]MDH4254200.1 hypothetical protein [Gammaproteobacteria bacterium]MDH5309029.1 hypothetical protein [Gammaproteobacteria bacterium]
MSAAPRLLTRTATWIAWASFACRVLVPVGYMPAALADGGPFVLCPGGYQAELLQYLDSAPGDARHAAGHGAHAAGDHAAHAERSDCSIGATFAAVAPTASLPLAMPAPQIVPPLAPAERLTASTTRARYHSRAPPAPLPA